MKRDIMRRAIFLMGLVLPMTSLPRSAAAQTAQSFGVSVNTATVNQRTPSAVLPAGEEMAQEQGQSVNVPGLVTAQDAFAIATGDADPLYGSDAVSSTTLGAVSLLNGLISADGVVAMATSSSGEDGAASDAEGSSLSNLVVNGVQVSDPAPNTRMSLPNVGYVVLNEQQRRGNGVTSSGLTVNMIHVVLTDLLGQKIGEIILGSAMTAVGS